MVFNYFEDKIKIHFISRFLPFLKVRLFLILKSYGLQDEFKLGLFGDGKKMSLLADRVRHLLYSPTVCFFSCTWITSHDGAFTGQMFDLLDSNHDGVIDFGEFVRSLNVFHPDTPQVEKAICTDQISMFYNTLLQMPQKHDQPQAHGNVLLCDFTVAFKLYDIWETGFIERGEVMRYLDTWNSDTTTI